MSGELVLVTGGSGFIGAHCILQLLDAGYRVRTTVRSLKREADVRAMLKVGGAEPGAALSFAAADLTSDAGWPDAVAGCERAVGLSIHRHPVEASRVVGHRGAVLAGDRDQVVLGLYALDARVLTRIEPERLAAFGVTHDIA